MLPPLVILIPLGAWLLYELTYGWLMHEREVERLDRSESFLSGHFGNGFRRFCETIGNRFITSDRESKDSLANKLFMGGLESSFQQGKYLFFKIVSILAGPLLGSLAFLYWPRYYATIFLLVCSAIGLVLPILWLNSRVNYRTQEIQRELPFMLDLTNLGCSAGWDLGSSLERVIDALNLEIPNHPLIKEFYRSRLMTASGYTWAEALNRAASRLQNDSVTRSTLALEQALKQGGDRTSQLEGIAEDAQRIYYANLDKKLAALPVQAVLITMLLMIGYLTFIMAPTIPNFKAARPAQSLEH